MATHSSILAWKIPWMEVHTVKGFGVVNKAEVDVLLELSCFFHDPADVGNLISGSSAFSNQLQHLEVHSSCIAEAWLGEV